MPDRIVDHFIACIFTGELVPGERLPGDRELAPLLGVDRTSLRIATQQLARLGVIKVVHGSGVRVLDFREHAGLDFLAAVFALPQLSLGSTYLLQLLDDWIDLIPLVTGRALARATPSQILELDALMAEQLEALDAGRELTHVAALEVALQDHVMRMLGNTSVVLLGNSSRPLRLRLVVLFFETSDPRQHVSAQRRFLAGVMASSPVQAGPVTFAQRAYLQECTRPLRQRIQAMPVNPSLASTGETHVLSSQPDRRTTTRKRSASARE